MTNVAQRLLTSAAADPAAPAIRLDNETLSCAALAGASGRLARCLTGRGLTPVRDAYMQCSKLPTASISSSVLASATAGCRDEPASK